MDILDIADAADNISWTKQDLDDAYKALPQDMPQVAESLRLAEKRIHKLRETLGVMDLKVHNCPRCGKLTETNPEDHSYYQFCSKECRDEAADQGFLCVNCNAVMSEDREFCSIKCQREAYGCGED